MNAQCQRVITYMKRNSRKGITGLEALTHLGIIHLASRISDLIAAGHKISKLGDGQESLWRVHPHPSLPAGAVK